MKHKLKWYSVMLIGITLLLGVSVISCCQYTEKDLEETYQRGYDVVYERGRNAGYTEGERAGYDKGLAECDKAKDETEIIPPPDKVLPLGAIWWYEAKDHIGERTTVCGPVVSTIYASGSKGKPTFLNIGKPYPDSGRFTVVIWGENRGNFPQPPENYYLGKTICVTGLIMPYDGIPEIEVTSPDQIQEQ